jgi:HEAT repeat protein
VGTEARATARAGLLVAAGDADSRVRVAACRALGTLGADAEALRLLQQRVREDPKDFVRGAAVEALAAMGGDVAVATLREALAMDSYRDEVRVQAIRGLAKHAPPDALERVRPFVAYAWGRGGQHAVREAALDAVVALAPRAAETQALLAECCADPYFRMRGWAVAHLAKQPTVSDAARDALRRVAEGDPLDGHRTAAQAALATLLAGPRAGTAPVAPATTGAPAAGDPAAAERRRRLEQLRADAEALRLRAEGLEREIRRLEAEAAR